MIKAERRKRREEFDRRVRALGKNVTYTGFYRLAREYGVTETTVWQWWKEFKDPEHYPRMSRHQVLTEEQKIEIGLACVVPGKGTSLSERVIASRFGVTVYDVRRLGRDVIESGMAAEVAKERDRDVFVDHALHRSRHIARWQREGKLYSRPDPREALIGGPWSKLWCPECRQWLSKQTASEFSCLVCGEPLVPWVPIPTLSDSSQHLVDQVLVEMRRVWGEDPNGGLDDTAFDGTAEEYAWLETNYGVTEEEDVHWQCVVHAAASSFSDDDLDEYNMMLFLWDQQAVEAFLHKLFAKYRSSTACYEQESASSDMTGQP